MAYSTGESSRRTTTDLVYENIHADIQALRLLPGAKLSETDVAVRFGVSRQPVRNAFARLGNEDLLVIRPQRATEVGRFSMQRIAYSRFVRLAVEVEVIRRACQIWDDDCLKAHERNLRLQEEAIAADDMQSFHACDYAFHKLICERSGQPMAFEAIGNSKQQVDRLCVLSLARDREATTVLEDHRQLAQALAARDVERAEATIRCHLSRLDSTIEIIHQTHPSYFE